MLVTQMLKHLTRVQVAYLNQQFNTSKEGRAWLKRALGRGYEANLDELHAALEDATHGGRPDSLNLAFTLLDRQREIERIERALAIAKKTYPDHVLAQPTTFVITEQIAAAENEDPLPVTMVGWDVHHPTLLPPVDVVTLISKVDKERHVRGQAAMDDLLTTLALRIETFEGLEIAIAPPGIDPVERGVKVSRIPLGFVIGASEHA